MNKLIVHAGAQDDFSESYLYYAKQSRRAAEKFAAQVRAAYERIVADPKGGTALDGHYRFRSLKNYPHLIVYEHVGDNVTIVAVYHPSREPDYWRTRTSDET